MRSIPEQISCVLKGCYEAIKVLLWPEQISKGHDLSQTDTVLGDEALKVLGTVFAPIFLIALERDGSLIIDAGASVFCESLGHWSGLSSKVEECKLRAHDIGLLAVLVAAVYQRATGIVGVSSHVVFGFLEGLEVAEIHLNSPIGGGRGPKPPIRSDFDQLDGLVGSALDAEFDAINFDLIADFNRPVGAMGLGAVVDDGGMLGGPVEVVAEALGPHHSILGVFAIPRSIAGDRSECEEVVKATMALGFVADREGVAEAEDLFSAEDGVGGEGVDDLDFRSGHFNSQVGGGHLVSRFTLSAGSRPKRKQKNTLPRK